AWAQRLTLDIPGLADRASEVVDITLDGPLLRMAAKFLSGADPDERAVGEMVRKLEGVYVRSYTFDKEGEYDPAIVQRVRGNLVPPWKRIVNVRERNMKETSEIYANIRGEDVIGLTIINAEPRELTIVNLLGP